MPVGGVAPLPLASAPCSARGPRPAATTSTSHGGFASLATTRICEKSLYFRSLGFDIWSSNPTNCSQHHV